MIADKSSGISEEIVSIIPVELVNIVLRLKCLAINAVSYEVIVGAPSLVQLYARIDMYH